jgi:hypothetical protein
MNSEQVLVVYIIRSFLSYDRVYRKRTRYDRKTVTVFKSEEDNNVIKTLSSKQLIERATMNSHEEFMGGP